MALSITRSGSSGLRSKATTSRCFSKHSLVVLCSSYQDDAPSYSQPVPVPGERLQKWLGSPFDLLTFGPRAGAGLAVSLPERLQTMQYDAQRLMDLIQDPRPMNEKQELLFKEVEETVVEFLEKGVTVERDVLANLKNVLPQEAAMALTELIPEPPNAAVNSMYADPPMTDSNASASMSTFTPPSYRQEDVYSVQIASEINEIRVAVASLKASLDTMRANEDVAATNMLRLNLREARDQLARRLAEVSPSTAPDPSVAAATREANILLEEVNAMFFASS